MNYLNNSRQDAIRQNALITYRDNIHPELSPFTPKGFSERRNREWIWNRDQFYPPQFRISLYRFLRENLPLINACIWTWSRLCSAPGRYEITDTGSPAETNRAEQILNDLSLRIFPFDFQKMAGMESFAPLLFKALFTDGAFAGFVVLNSDMSGIEKFQPVDPISIGSRTDKRGNICLVMSADREDITIDGDDFYYFGLNCDQTSGLGQSILNAIPFVAYIEQQLIEDMRRTTHNAGYHRLHVQITPPEKLSGESDNAYVTRINEYFDESVSMIKGCAPEDNPVTWDNVKIEYIGPRQSGSVTNAWFLNHRTMIEEICAGTNLSPFMLGYSYGTTHNWAQFKYDLVMRQVQSIQRQAARFLEWLGNIELALKGINGRCHYRFNNALSYLAAERAEIEKGRIDNVVKLFSAGLISRDDAIQKIGELI